MQCRQVIQYVALQVSHQLGRPLYRKFAPLRKIDFVEQGWGLNIAPPPEPRTARVGLNHLCVHLSIWCGSITNNLSSNAVHLVQDAWETLAAKQIMKSR